MRLVAHGAIEPLRVDHGGSPRLVALAPDLDDLVLLGFEQVRAMIVEQQQQVLAVRLVAWLGELDRAAAEAGLPRREIHRQLNGLRPTAESAGG